MRVHPTLGNREITYDEDNEFARWEEEEYSFEEYASSFQSSSSLRTISEQFKIPAEKSTYRFPTYFLPCRRKISMSLQHDRLWKDFLIFSGNRFEIYVAKSRFCPMVAIKMVKSCIDMEGAAVREIINEMQLLTKLQHPNIIAIKGARISGVPFVVLEQLDGGTLSELIESRKSTLPLRTALDIAHQLVSALKYLQEDLNPYAMVIHRDLKRLFCSMAYNMTAIDGNSTYMAPEALNKQPYNEKVDIFSFGVILQLLLTGDTANNAYVVQSNQIDNAEPKRSTSTAMQLLIDLCTASDYYIRPTCSMILNYLEEEMKRATMATFTMTAFMLWRGFNDLRALSKRLSKIFLPVH